MAGNLQLRNAVKSKQVTIHHTRWNSAANSETRTSRDNNKKTRDLVKGFPADELTPARFHVLPQLCCTELEIRSFVASAV
jgi:hypothetical protein